MTTSTASGGLRRATRQVAVVTAAARVVGFLRWFVFAWALGSTAVGSVYQSVNAVPNLVYEVAAGGVLSAVVVPLVAQARREARADDVASSLLTGTVLVLAPAALLLGLLAAWVAPRLVDGVDGPGVADLATRLLVLFSPQVVLYGIGIVTTGVLQAHERLLAAAVTPLLSSLVVIATYVLYALVVPHGTGTAAVPAEGWWVLGVGTTLGVVALSVPLLAVAARAGVRWRPRWSLRPDDLARARRLAGAGLLGLVAQQLALLVVIRVSNRSGGDGVLVVQQYAQAVYLLPYAVLAVPVATATFARLAGTVEPAVGRGEGTSGVPVAAGEALNRSLRGIVALAGIATAALVGAAPAIGEVFRLVDRARGSGPGAAPIDAMPVALATTALGLVGFSVSALAVRALYVRGSSLGAGIGVAVGWVVAALVPVLVLGREEGAQQTLTVLGLASALGMTLAGLLLVRALVPAWGAGVVAGLARTTAALVPGVVLAGLLARWVQVAGLGPAGTITAGTIAGLAAGAVAASAAHLVGPDLVRSLRGAQ